jgi:hypothetical protein
LQNEVGDGVTVGRGIGTVTILNDD